MTGNQRILIDYKSFSNGQVIFSDGVQGRVLYKGTFKMEGFPRLEDVPHVYGLKAILINIKSNLSHRPLRKLYL